MLDNEDEARKIARELHTATHLGGHPLWKLFCDQYSHKSGRRICLETAQSCPQFQLGTDYSNRQNTIDTIQSQSSWDTLSIDIVGPLPPDHHHEFQIVFVDCFSKYTILVPSSNHTANRISEALMRQVIPYFGPSSCAHSGSNKSSPHPITLRATRSTRGAIGSWITCSAHVCWKDLPPKPGSIKYPG